MTVTTGRDPPGAVMGRGAIAHPCMPSRPKSSPNRVVPRIAHGDAEGARYVHIPASATGGPASGQSAGDARRSLREPDRDHLRDEPHGNAAARREADRPSSREEGRQVRPERLLHGLARREEAVMDLSLIPISEPT